ncbi:hypothetical protein TRFO_31208 [Tritrichomonas foetus]|uniref:C2H2-type domain-containing protein n=1 Tax=Tritrichomonas foetus TaxID=1144522 RepID=A0A1J4JS44_9EUKA|nr:hypothetical protein TRFO_31208 [Tritrichomonas foetus]|eukprot:OHT01867.1 hypothetical protein TRFO_31208 [Tritrichomonas foetus]
MIFPDISFGEGKPKLRSYYKYQWNPRETRIIEFYPNQKVSVTLLYSSDPNLLETLLTYVDGNPISIDLEWAQPYNHSPHIIELFQFASSKGVVIVASDSNTGYDKITQFLNSSKFFGKGMSSDKKKLYQCCGQKFDMEDIEITRLLPNNLSINFETITNEFLGKSTASFKDHRVQRSDWSVRPLSILQILYGAHDAYSMLLVYQKLIEKFGSEIKPFIRKSKTEKTKGNNKRPFKNENLVCKFVNIDFEKFEKNLNLFVEENPIPIKTQLFNYINKKRGKTEPKYEDENLCFLENSNEIMHFLLQKKSKDEKLSMIKAVNLTSDLLFYGIIINQNEKLFSCIPCDKNLHDVTSLLQHSVHRHAPLQFPNDSLNSNPNSSNSNKSNPNPEAVDVKNMLLRFLTATKRINCPFSKIYLDSELRNTTIEEEDQDEGISDSDDDGLQANRPYITPMVYNQDEGIKCRICNSAFHSIEEIKNHCWIDHNDIFVDIFSKKVTKNNDIDEKVKEFGLFLINQLNLSNVTQDPQMIHCKKCDFETTEPSKFFTHMFFKHQTFSFVKKKQFDQWPMKYSAFAPNLKKLINRIVVNVPFDDLEDNGLFNHTNNMCLDCNVKFPDEETMLSHYIEDHLIYYPLL